MSPEYAPNSPYIRFALRVVAFGGGVAMAMSVYPQQAYADADPLVVTVSADQPLPLPAPIVGPPAPYHGQDIITGVVHGGSPEGAPAPVSTHAASAPEPIPLPAPVIQPPRLSESPTAVPIADKLPAADAPAPVAAPVVSIPKAPAAPTQPLPDQAPTPPAIPAAPGSGTGSGSSGSETTTSGAPPQANTDPDGTTGPNPNSSPAPPDPNKNGGLDLKIPHGDTKTLARMLMAEAHKPDGLISFQTPEEEAWFQHIADTGHAISCGGPEIDPRLISDILGIAYTGNARVVVGVLTDGHVCDRFHHTYGQAVDINGYNPVDTSLGGTGNHIGTRPTSGKFSPEEMKPLHNLYDVASAVMAANGGGNIGRLSCLDTPPKENPEVGYFDDACSHVHIDVGAKGTY